MMPPPTFFRAEWGGGDSAAAKPLGTNFGPKMTKNPKILKMAQMAPKPLKMAWEASKASQKAKNDPKMKKMSKSDFPLVWISYVARPMSWPNTGGMVL